MHVYKDTGCTRNVRNKWVNVRKFGVSVPLLLVSVTLLTIRAVRRGNGSSLRDTPTIPHVSVC